MVIPRHKVCDICKEEVGINNRYYIIRSKNQVVGCWGSTKDNRTHHICEDCMCKITDAIRERIKSNK